MSWAFKRSDPCPEEAMAGMIHPTNPHIDKSESIAPMLPKNCSTARQLSKSRRCFGNSGAVFSTTYEWRLNCHLSDTSCDGDEEPDAEDHPKGKRRSGL